MSQVACRPSVRTTILLTNCNIPSAQCESAGVIVRLASQQKPWVHVCGCRQWVDVDRRVWWTVCHLARGVWVLFSFSKGIFTIDQSKFTRSSTKDLMSLEMSNYSQDNFQLEASHLEFKTDQQCTCLSVVKFKSRKRRVLGRTQIKYMYKQTPQVHKTTTKTD